MVLWLGLGLAALVALVATPSCTLDRMGTNPNAEGGSGGRGLDCDGPEDCPGVDTTCRARSCINGTCGFVNYAGSPCTEDGGRFCDDQGNCVWCTEDTHCVAPEVCRQGQCISAACEDGQLNGDETDVDCGGSCLPCGNGLRCNQGTDCQSGYCDPNSNQCSICSTHADCPGQYCDATDQACRDTKIDGEGCLESAECQSGFCPGHDGVCCAAACDALCMACIEGKTGQPSGACSPVQANSDPDGECDDDVGGCMSSGAGCDGQATPACIVDAQGTNCGATAGCVSGTATSEDTCDGAGSCVIGGTEQCSPYFCDGAECATECSDHNDCVTNHWCDPTPNPDQCAQDKDLGASCGSDLECIDNEDCEDSVCCDMQCDGACLDCDSTNPGHCSGHTCTCQEQYGHTEYEGCTTAVTDQCKFFTSMTRYYSCGELCRDRGGRCLESYNDGADHCTEDGLLDCFSEGYNGRICICTLGCNGNPRCRPNQQCDSGGC